jgi:hypothetical protein
VELSDDGSREPEREGLRRQNEGKNRRINSLDGISERARARRSSSTRGRIVVREGLLVSLNYRIKPYHHCICFIPPYLSFDIMLHILPGINQSFLER